MPTARTFVPSRNGRQRIRVLIDTGSHTNAITVDACKRLGLEIRQSKATVTGINQDKLQPVIGSTNVALTQNNGQSPNVPRVVLPKITYGDNPKTQIVKQELDKVKRYILADASFGTPGEIDLLVGVPILN